MLSAPLNEASPVRQSKAHTCRVICGVTMGFAMTVVPDCMCMLRHIEHISRVTSTPMLPASLAVNTTVQENMSLATILTSQCIPNPHLAVPLFGSQCPTMSHYCYDAAGWMHWFPVDNCPLPPPQTFWMIGSGTSVKGIGVAVVFWTKFDGEANLWKDWAFVFLTVASVVVSIVLLIIQCFTMSGFSSFWQHAECAGMIFSTAPWTQNMLLYAYKGTASLSFKTYLKTVSKQKMAEEKSWAYVIIALCTAITFVICNGFFTVTNLIPALFAFCWIALVCVCLGVGLSFCMLYKLTQRFVETSEKKVNMMGIPFIPFIISMDILVQYLSAASVYLYKGIGYLPAAWMAASERQSDLYYNNFGHQVLAKAAWLSELIQQVLP